MKRKWYCWHCGDLIGEEFYLWSLNDRVDRVFIICSKKFCFTSVKTSGGPGYRPFILKGKEIV